MPDRVLQLDSRDNVLIALTDLSQGEQIEFAGNTYTLVSSVPAKHKFATQDLAAGAAVIMYGVLVGKAAKPIQPGREADYQQRSAPGFRFPRAVRPVPLAGA